MSHELTSPLRSSVLIALSVFTLASCSKKPDAPQASKDSSATAQSNPIVTPTTTDTTSVPATKQPTATMDIPRVMSVSATAPKNVATDFQWSTADGAKHSLKDYKGKVVVLNFWATWCPPCREELPALVALQKDLSPKGVQVLGVSLDADEDGKSAQSLLAQFIPQNEINYPVVIGTQELTAAYGGVEGIPETIVIDANGKIVERLVGGQESSAFRAAVEKALH